MESAPPFTADKFRASNGISSRFRPLIRQEEGRFGLHLVSANDSFCSVQQSVHFTGTVSNRTNKFFTLLKWILQYFLWYLLLLPLLIPQLHMATWRAGLYTGVWIGIQALWLAEGYRLEFLGQDVFVSLWIRSLIYVLGNCWIIAGVMDSYAQTPLEIDGT